MARAGHARNDRHSGLMHRRAPSLFLIIALIASSIAQVAVPVADEALTRTRAQLVAAGCQEGVHEALAALVRRAELAQRGERLVRRGAHPGDRVAPLNRRHRRVELRNPPRHRGDVFAAGLAARDSRGQGARLVEATHLHDVLDRARAIHVLESQLAVDLRHGAHTEVRISAASTTKPNATRRLRSHPAVTPAAPWD